VTGHCSILANNIGKNIDGNVLDPYPLPSPPTNNPQEEQKKGIVYSDD
jgi:hypothetical protein